jgi:hypothetical protein
MSHSDTGSDLIEGAAAETSWVGIGLCICADF